MLHRSHLCSALLCFFVAAGIRIAGSNYVYLAVGSKLQLNCSLPAGRNVGWYHNGVAIQHSDNPDEGFYFPTPSDVSASGQSVSILEKASVEQSDFGLYKCKLIAGPGEAFMGGTTEYSVEVKQISGM